jgi:hypothetical protein
MLEAVQIIITSSDLQGKRCCDKDGGKSSDAINKRSLSHVPVFAADVLMVLIPTTVDDNAENDEDL